MDDLLGCHVVQRSPLRARTTALSNHITGSGFPHLTFPERHLLWGQADSYHSVRCLVYDCPALARQSRPQIHVTHPQNNAVKQDTNHSGEITPACPGVAFTLRHLNAAEAVQRHNRIAPAAGHEGTHTHTPIHTIMSLISLCNGLFPCAATPAFPTPLPLYTERRLPQVWC